jgi:hypothetical protein
MRAKHLQQGTKWVEARIALILKRTQLHESAYEPA